MTDQQPTNGDPDSRGKAAREARLQAEKAAQEARDEEVRLAAAGVHERRQTARQAGTHEPTHTPLRDGRVVVEGRNGEVLSRIQSAAIDPFEFAEAEIPKGWKYQWLSVSIHNNTEIVMDQNHIMDVNGWRPVPAERYPGRFMPKAHQGNIIRGQMMLVERPKVLCDEAEAESVAIAKRLITDRDQSLMGGKANLRANVPDGFAMGGKYRGTGGDVRLSIDRALDIPMPSHTLAEPGQ